MRTSAAARAPQRGLSMVELLVGIAIALFIAAAGATLLAGNLRENRNLLLEARLMQDLRSAVDTITRDLRRAGYWSAATDGVWRAGADHVGTNPYLAVSPGAAASDAVSFRYSHDAAAVNASDTAAQFGYRLRGGALEMQLGGANWQAMTDPGTLEITEFRVTPTTQDIPLQSFCASECPRGSATCPPHQQVRSLALLISGHLTGDPGVTRSIRSDVRLRNDPVIGACAG